MVLALLGLLFLVGCTEQAAQVKAAEAFARRALSESLMVRAELREVRGLKMTRKEGAGYGFKVVGSRQGARLGILMATRDEMPPGTLFLDDGRQLPLFVDSLEESYAEGEPDPE
jgi:hypothetical protein